MFEERQRRNKMKLENGAVYYLDLGRMSFQQLLYRPILPPLEGDGVISTNLFFPPFSILLFLFLLVLC